MVVIKEFAAQFQIQFAIELGYSFPNMFRLNLEIFLIIETNFHHVPN